MPTITIPKNLIMEKDLMIIPRSEYEGLFKRIKIIEDYEHISMEYSLYHNQMLAAYKLGWIIKNKISNNQIKKDFSGNYPGNQYYGFIFDV